MKPVEGGTIHDAHEIFHLDGYWSAALVMKYSGDYSTNREVYHAIEGQLSRYGFTRYTTFESWKKELYRRLRMNKRL